MADMAPTPLECAQLLWETIPSLMRSLHSAMQQKKSGEELHNMGQSRMLEILRRGPRTLSALAAMHHVTPSTMSRSIDVLVRKGWVTRASDSHDRRQVSLSITDEGCAAQAAMHQYTQELLGQLFEQLDAVDRVRLYDGLSVLRKLPTRPPCEESSKGYPTESQEA